MNLEDEIPQNTADSDTCYLGVAGLRMERDKIIALIEFRLFLLFTS